MKNFEKEARKQLDQHKSPIEIKPVWDKINLELRPQRKKPALFWWPLGISLLGLSLFLILNPSGNLFNSELITNNASNKTPAKINHTPNTFNKSITSSNNDNLNNTINTQESNKTLASSKSNITQSNNTYSTKGGYKTKRNNKSRTHINYNQINNDNISDKETDIINLNSVSENTLIDNNKLTLNNSINYQADLKENKEYPELLESKIFLVSAPVNIESISSFNAPIQNYKKERFSLYMSIYGGYGYPIKSLVAKDINSKTYEGYRSSTETTLDILQFGLLLGSKTYSGLFVESGFEFTRINERFDWKKTVTDSIGKYVITGYIINAPGDTSFIKDSVDILRVTNYNKRIYNNYSFYSIPITVGYEFNRMLRTRFYLKAGVLVNLRLDNKVAMLDETGLPSTSDYNVPNTMFKSKIGITPFISAGLKYSFNNTVELFGELNYKHLNDISVNSYSLKQGYNLLSANLGLQFNF